MDATVAPSQLNLKGILTCQLYNTVKERRAAKVYLMHMDCNNVRIPTKPAMHSNLMPATYSDFIPAGIPI